MKIVVILGMSNLQLVKKRYLMIMILIVITDLKSKHNNHSDKV